MTLHELLKSESQKNAGKPLVLDAVRTLMNVSREVFDVVLSELVQSGICVLSMVDGQVMVQYVPSFPVSATVSSVPEPSVKAGVKAVKRGRPLIPEHLRRVRLSFARVPAWLAEHLQLQKQAGKHIEKALLEYYCLSPPG